MIKEDELISRVLVTLDQFKNLDYLKAAIAKSEYTPYNSGNYSRVLVWKACLITGSLNINDWDLPLKNSRVVYHQLLHRLDMKAPYHMLERDNAFYDTSPRLRSVSPVKTNLTRTPTLDILSRKSTPPLKYTHTDDDLDLLNTIIMDIDRLFPGEAFFSNENSDNLTNKKKLIELLYIWAKCNAKVQYKQGLHEILGLLFMNLSKESMEIPQTNQLSNEDKKILNLFSKKFLFHDLFTIFNKFVLESRVIARFYETEEELWKSIEYFNVKLMKIDQLIHYNLTNKLKLDTQLWIIRYLRLLLSRELGDLSIVSLLWDKLIATTTKSTIPVPDLIIFMTMSLLIQAKKELVVCDFSESLVLLLHYPLKGSKRAQVDFINNIYKDGVNLYEKRDNDLQLYEYGIKMNSKYNSEFKTVVSSSKANTQDMMKFEKTRLEMRLQKKAREMINK